VSDSNQILTFQGHPDVTAKIAEEILKGEAGSFTCKLTAGELAKVKSSLDLPHDGLQVFGKIMDWILE
jgi:GMP synthase-like glutamine amidotransferase